MTKDYDKLIDTLQKQVTALEKEREVYNALTFEQHLAIHMHDTFCHWNHNDGCSWGYEHDEIGMWNKSEHQRWLAKAALLNSEFKHISIDQWKKMFRIIK
jgi:hypothetical protein